MSVLLIWFFSNAINSPAGLAAAVGPIIIPVLIRAGVHPAMAAATVLLGTWGEFTSISSSLTALVGSYSKTDVPTIVLQVLPASLTCLVVTLIGITVTALLRHENKGYVCETSSGQAEDVEAEVKAFKVNYLKALMPLLPIILLILGTDQVGPLSVKITFATLSVLHGVVKHAIFAGVYR